MFFQVLFSLIFLVPITHGCMAMIPPDDGVLTTTFDPWSTTEGECNEECPETTTGELEESTTSEEEDTTTEMESTTAGNFCDQCDIDKIAPVLADPSTTEFYSEEDPPVDGCQRTYTICQRTDNLVCASVEMLATNADGQSSIQDLSTGATVSATLSCDKDGTYSWMSVSGIESLSCVFTDCK